MDTLDTILTPDFLSKHDKPVLNNDNNKKMDELLEKVKKATELDEVCDYALKYLRLVRSQIMNSIYKENLEEFIKSNYISLDKVVREISRYESTDKEVINLYNEIKMDLGYSLLDKVKKFNYPTRLIQKDVEILLNKIVEFKNINYCNSVLRKIDKISEKIIVTTSSREVVLDNQLNLVKHLIMLFKDIKIQNGRDNLILIDRITSRFDNREEKASEDILEKVKEESSEEVKEDNN
ncbi:MAG: hypothetical protein E7214_15105 [Clostridium sp.]|nr:hypothetical protein [Clostridium sp.]